MWAKTRDPKCKVVAIPGAGGSERVTGQGTGLLRGVRKVHSLNN